MGNFTGLDQLKAATAPGAFHNSRERFDPPKCHPHTREAVLTKIIEWVEKKIDTDSFILWLWGAAGAGKSAIAQTIAELCHEQKLLLASFFFSRNAPRRSTSEYLFASIAYQMVLAIPATRGLVLSAIEEDPLIFERSLESQFTTLIARPLSFLLESGNELDPFPSFIIIDGLDECTDGTRRNIVDALVRVTKRFSLPLIFLLASRREQDITLAIESAKTDVTRIPLDTEYHPCKDIERYLRDKISEIRDTHPLRYALPPSWPSDNEIWTLTRKSSGQFIYASTAVQYFSSPSHHPTQRLGVIIGVIPPGRSDLPFAELDALYKFLINSTKNPQLIARILFALNTLFTPWPHVVEPALSLESGDSILLLSDLGALVFTNYSNNGPGFHILHASVIDFLGDPARSGDLYVDPGLLRADIVCRVLHILQQPEYPGEHVYISSSSPLNPNHPEVTLCLAAGGSIQSLCCRTTPTTELLSNLLDFRLTERMLRNLGWSCFQQFVASFAEATRDPVGYSSHQIFRVY